MIKLICVVFLLILSTASLAEDPVNTLEQFSGVKMPAETGGIMGGFSTAGIMAAMVFSAIGLGVFMYGKKKQNIAQIVIGILLMGYSYLVQDTALICLIGAALCSGLYFFRQ